MLFCTGSVLLCYLLGRRNEKLVEGIFETFQMGRDSKSARFIGYNGCHCGKKSFVPFPSLNSLILIIITDLHISYRADESGARTKVTNRRLE